jgi:AmmeMemoRadiSam system protein A
MLDPILLRIAKTAILSKFDPKYTIDKERLIEEYPYLAKPGAAFVTLNKAKNLRGCIGSIIAHQSLLDDIIQNAQSAAFSDPRFNPLRPEEIDDTLTLEVSVLSEPERIEYSDFEDLKRKIVPHKDGLILKYGQYQGTFLPQVWEQLPTPEQFLEHLSYKAGANPSIYSLHPEIYRYRVEHIEDRFNEILPL